MDPVIERINQAARSDAVMCALRDAIVRGFPDSKRDLPAELKPYWGVRDRLAIDDRDDMIVVGARLVIPAACRKAILQDLAHMHQGATKLRQ